MQGISSDEKVKHLKQLRIEVFVSCFLQIYAIRIANTLSFITLMQTGKRYYKNQISLKKSNQGSEEEAKDEGEMQSLLN